MSQRTLGRRDFLKGTAALAGCFFATAGPACKPRRVFAAQAEPGRFTFPQGVASGDPRPDAVVFWTRVEAVDPSSDPIDVTLEVDKQSDFGTLVLQRDMTVGPDSDHTARVVVDGLEPDTIYYYRFRAGADTSRLLGRTRTAPAPGADRTVRFAFMSCQNYEAGFYGAWRRMVHDDMDVRPDKQIDFVVNLGDFIYESIRFPSARAQAAAGGALLDRNGRKRVIAPFPESTSTRPGGRPYAETIADYRHLYKTYLSDPDLQAARARWPFISTWDDHEFTNDCWQSRTTYTHEGLPTPRRKVAANQAWFEYIPVMLSGVQRPGDVDQPARDFVYIDVENVESTGDYSAEPNNRAAIGSMTIYRSLRFGKHVDLVITDTRSYRSDHPVPEPIAVQLGGGERTMMPLEAVQVFDAGRDYNGGHPPDTISLGGAEIVNERKDAPPGTVLGGRQKQWWKDAMAGSKTTWKFWANSIPCLPLRIDFNDLLPGGHASVLSADAWDGYPTERSELMRYLLERGIPNVVSLAGDHHMHFAGFIMDDFEADAPVPVAPEFSVAGISSTPTFRSIVGRSNLPKPFRDMTVLEQTGADGETSQLELFNLTILQGVKASFTAVQTGDIERAKAVRNPRQNPHLRYFDSNSNGYGLVTASADETTVDLVTIDDARIDRGPHGPAMLRRARCRIARCDAGQTPGWAGPEFTGTPPFPFA